MNLRRWSRRNRWGLIALVPALAIALVVPVEDFRDQRWDKQPHTPIAAAADGSVSYDHATISLVTLIQPAGLQDFAGAPIAIPADLTVWQAKLRFRATVPNAVTSCAMFLTADDGSTYDADPNSLNDLGLYIEDLPYCSAALDDAGKARSDWTLTLFFLTPKTVKPAGVQINADRELPRYALLKPAK